MLADMKRLAYSLSTVEYIYVSILTRFLLTRW